MSGGVDSTVMAALAHQALGERTIGVTFESPLTPPGELEDARASAQVIGIRHRVEGSDELAVASIAANPQDRCYYCKQFRFAEAQKLAKKLGFATVVDGTTQSDLGQHRPGLRALKNLGIVSPLSEAGITKEEARQLARQLELPVAEKPSNSCLATRIPYGEPLTIERLRRIARAEEAIQQIAKVQTLRVRDHGELARIEVATADLPQLANPAVAERVVQRLRDLGYRYVALDLAGYRFGSFD
jgi:uncharacterized protein